jgi:EmrB/QacA subfamily drug resistance transporter
VINTTKKVALLVATLGGFLTPFSSHSINIALPSIGKEFSMNAISLSWLVTAYLLASAIFLVPLGKIADIYGRKRIFIYGILSFTITSFFLAISNSVTMLICFRILQGIGGAVLFGTGVAILTSVFPIEERGKVLGINVAAVYIGASLGPFLGGFLTEQFGWRSIFFVNVFLGLGILLLIFWKLKGEWAEAKGEKFDFVGSIIYSFTLITVIYGLSLLPKMLGAFLILLGVLGILTFVKWEIRTESPVLDINLFKNNRVFAFSNLASFINYSAAFAVAFLLSLYLQYIKEFTPQDAGLILIFQPIIQALFSPFAGRLSDRIEPRIVASMGMGMTTIGLFLLSFLDVKTPIGFIVANLIIIGFGFALFASPNTNAAISSVEKRFYGVASGILATMRLTGQMFNMGITMLIFAIYIGKVQITPQYHPLFLRSIKIAFTFFAVLGLGGVLASFARGKVR